MWDLPARSKGTPRRRSVKPANNKPGKAPEPIVWPTAKIVAGAAGRRHRSPRSPGACWSGCSKTSLRFDTISGASVGAINALLLACGLAEGGREGAIARCSQFWRPDDARGLVPLADAGRRLLAGRKLGRVRLRRLRSGQFDPFDLDPLRQALSRDIDFAALRDPQLPKAPDRGNAGARRPAADFRNGAITADVAAGLDLPAAGPLRRRDRRRILLGWRLWRQSAARAAGAGIG